MIRIDKPSAFRAGRIRRSGTGRSDSKSDIGRWPCGFSRIVKPFGFLILTLVLCACTNQQPVQSEIIQYYEVTTPKAYDDVLAELRIAISEHNFRVTSHSRVGQVIRERGAADFPDYDTIQFCNLSHAKTLIEISPDSVRHMPCTVVLYQSNGRTVIKTRLLPVDGDDPKLNEFSGTINGILKQIVDFAGEI